MLQAVLAQAQPLTFDFWTWLFESINVLIIMLLLYKFLWRPLQKVMHEREQFVENQLEHAKASRAEAERLLEQYQARIREAQQEAETIIKTATEKAEEAGQRIIREAEAEAQRTLERAKIEIAREREKALAAIREEVTGLVVLATGKLIGKTLTEEDHKRLIQQFVDEVAAARADASGGAKMGDAQ